MKIELIPVIELAYNIKEVEIPKEFPYWENQDIWNDFQTETFKKAGFIDKLVPYMKGSFFFEVKKITDLNLEKIVLDWTEGLRCGESEREDLVPLSGGYVLRVDGEDKFFPQCCGDLSDIAFWEKITRKENSYYEGHPAPNYKFCFNKIIFDFSVGKCGEYFEPKPPEIKVRIDLKALRFAVENVKIELEVLAQRLIKLNHKLNLEIDRIDDLFIYENPNHD